MEQPEPPPQSTARLDNLDVEQIAVPTMVHTANSLSWGKVVIHENLRINLILVGSSVPDYISLYEAHRIRMDGTEVSKPAAYSELHIPTENILGFHVMPPMIEALDYEEDEPNRIMQPLVCLLGSFEFHGLFRMSSQTDLHQFLGVSKSKYLSLYDVEIRHTTSTQMKPIKSHMVQLRRDALLMGIVA